MKKSVIVIFDIGKTNKKLLLFDEWLNLIYENEVVFEEITDDDGFACEDMEKLEKWIKDSLESLVSKNDYIIKSINFSTYGATIVYLDKNGKRVTPIYNYLKPMTEGLLDEFYPKYGGVEEFSRKTASPALGMLNSGLQIYWLKYTKPKFWGKTRYILHLPQYISYLYTGEKVSEYTSIGCHTALWDFDNMRYHRWVKDEDINLPDPISNSTVFDFNIKGRVIKVGIGIHDSSASLAPYLSVFKEYKFVLLSTGTWAINMNPFSRDPLSAEELKKDCLCYLSVDQQQVKSSRLFLGHILEINVSKLCEYYKVDENEFKSVKTDEEILKTILKTNKFLFFQSGIPQDYYGDFKVLKQFTDFKSAYHQLIYELSRFEAEAIDLIFDNNDTTKEIYITGGFAKNDIFCRLLATFFSHKNVYSAELHNSTALGAAMVVNPYESSIKENIKLEKRKPIEL
ncbi:MAG: hypothetical protein JXB17_03340 [Bacteroidales bacterium]|nr:hypothetical protein [Bacteroidales bacterium]